MEFTLPETNLLKVSRMSEKGNLGIFVLEPLSPGYGMTVGNSLRRVLLSSLEGAAITRVKIAGVSHEFSTLPGCRDDVVDIILNLKKMRLKSDSNEPITLKLSKKGPGDVKASDFAKNAQVQIVDPAHYLAQLDSKGKISLEATVEKGRGYIPVEERKEEKMPLGTIALDAVFTPVKKVHYTVENTRVGGKTNFDKLSLEITTDGSISPTAALSSAAKILSEHFALVGELEEIKKRTVTAKAPSKAKIKKIVKKPVKKVAKPVKKTAKK